VDRRPCSESDSPELPDAGFMSFERRRRLSLSTTARYGWPGAGLTPEGLRRISRFIFALAATDFQMRHLHQEMVSWLPARHCACDGDGSSGRDLPALPSEQETHPETPRRSSPNIRYDVAAVFQISNNRLSFGTGRQPNSKGGAATRARNQPCHRRNASCALERLHRYWRE